MDPALHDNTHRALRMGLLLAERSLEQWLPPLPAAEATSTPNSLPAPNISPRAVTAAGASVSSWDIWSGGMRAFQLPRSTAQDVDKLLGNCGTPSDRHTLRLSTKCCAWDVTTAMTQWVLGGMLGYGPLLGVAFPADLHREAIDSMCFRSCSFWLFFSWPRPSAPFPPCSGLYCFGGGNLLHFSGREPRSGPFSAGGLCPPASVT